MPGPIPLAVALDVGGTKVARVLVSGDGQVLAQIGPLPTPGCGGRGFARQLAVRATVPPVGVVRRRPGRRRARA